MEYIIIISLTLLISYILKTSIEEKLETEIYTLEEQLYAQEAKLNQLKSKLESVIEKANAKPKVVKKSKK